MLYPGIDSSILAGEPCWQDVPIIVLAQQKVGCLCQYVFSFCFSFFFPLYSIRFSCSTVIIKPLSDCLAFRFRFAFYALSYPLGSKTHHKKKHTREYINAAVAKFI